MRPPPPPRHPPRNDTDRLARAVKDEKRRSPFTARRDVPRELPSWTHATGPSSSSAARSNRSVRRAKLVTEEMVHESNAAAIPKRYRWR